jgi:ABC-type cobalamin/Fe3+-siderophores transport system ATPase subunit
MLRVSNLNVFQDTNLILNNINLEVENGEIISILGPSGSGKSTLLRATSMIIQPQ